MGWLIAGLIALFLLGQFAFLYRSKGMQGRPAPEFSELLAEGQNAQDRLIIYFHSPRCSMCKHINKILEPILETRKDMILVDVGRNPDAARRFRVMGTPTLMLLNGGRIQRVIMGVKDEATILNFLDQT